MPHANFILLGIWCRLQNGLTSSVRVFSENLPKVVSINLSNRSDPAC